MDAIYAAPENFRRECAVHAVDLHQGYGARLVLENVDLSVPPLDLISVVGPSGCGKSTLLRIVLGQDVPLSGQVFVHGEPVMRPNQERGIVYQNYSLLPHLTVLQNVLAGDRLRHSVLWRTTSEYRAKRAEAMQFLEKAGIAEHAHKYPAQLSGGQSQRVAIVQTLFQRPRIVLMDEPFSALDPSTRENMQLWLLELWREYQLTVFFVTHDLEEACFLGTRLVALSSFYTDDRGDDPRIMRGSKIVMDMPIRHAGRISPPSIKETAEFGELIEHVRHNAFDPTHRQHVEQFELLHQYSWRTLTTDESHPKT